MLRGTFARGQALLETTIALGVLFVAIAIGAGAVLTLTGNEHPSQARLIALDAAGNAASELLAATAYDPNALTHVAAAEWSAGSVRLSTQVHAAGQARIVDMQYAAPGVTGVLSVTLRAATLPPDSVVDTTTAPASPGP
jgi:hypothetical protein